MGTSISCVIFCFKHAHSLPLQDFWGETSCQSHIKSFTSLGYCEYAMFKSMWFVRRRQYCFRGDSF